MAAPPMMQATAVRTVVPFGVPPGGRFRLQMPNGALFEAVAPPGAAAGTEIHVVVPCSAYPQARANCLIPQVVSSISARGREIRVQPTSSIPALEMSLARRQNCCRQEEDVGCCDKFLSVIRVVIHTVKIANIIWMAVDPPATVWNTDLGHIKFWLTILGGPVVILFTLRHWFSDTYFPMTRVDSLHIVRHGRRMDRHPPDVNWSLIVTLLFLGSFLSLGSMVNFAENASHCQMYTCDRLAKIQLIVAILSVVTAIKRFVLTVMFIISLWMVLLFSAILTLPCCCCGLFRLCRALTAGVTREDSERAAGSAGCWGRCGTCAWLYNFVAWFYVCL